MEADWYQHFSPLQWRHNEHNGVSNYKPRNCLLNRLFRRRSKSHQSSSSLAFMWGIHRWPMNSPHKRPVTRKILLFDDVIMALNHFGDITIKCIWYHSSIFNLPPASDTRKCQISTVNHTSCQPAELTHLPMNKMAAISQTIVSKASNDRKAIRNSLTLCPSVQLTIRQHWFREWLGTRQATSHYLNQCWPSSTMHIYGTRGRWVLS